MARRGALVAHASFSVFMERALRAQGCFYYGSVLHLWVRQAPMVLARVATWTPPLAT